MSDVSLMSKIMGGVEVKWEPLKELLVRTNGTRITVGQMGELHKEGAPVKIFAGGGTSAFVGFDDIPAKNINREPSIIVKSRGVIEFEFYDGPFSHKKEMWSYHSKSEEISIKYVYHFLKLNEPHFQDIGGKMLMSQISTLDTDTFPIPIPCPDNPEISLKIQSEIVRILDKFTELTRDLTCEFNARKKQYSHYRSKLLHFEESNVEWMNLSKVCTSISAGGDLPKNHIKGQTSPSNEFPYPIYSNATGDEGLYGYSDDYKIESDAVTICGRGRKVGYPMVRQGKFTTINRLVTLVPNKEIILTKYLSYILDANPIAGTKGVIAQLTVPAANKITIAVPAITEQERIVATLSQLDILTKSITDGITREIELRQKQYRYYGDLLFGFGSAEKGGSCDPC